MDFDVMYNELINASQALSILAENALKKYSDTELAGQLAQLSLELVDRLDELHAWVSSGGVLPGQIKEIQQTASSFLHIARVLDFIDQEIKVA